ncbi:hypothetical protein PInf_005381 [Phytophthora infestans]|nr:hypothetical protein PInf_005381 [Phytophthora infestans]
MRALLLLAVTLAVALLGICNGEVKSFLDFTIPDLKGHQVSMREFNAFPVILVVNVASDCGYTDKNYRELQELYEKYHDEGFMVLGFPCNQFGGQEPGTAEDILKFAQEKYHVTFPLFNKPSKRYGTSTSPLEIESDIVQALHSSRHVDQFDDGGATDGDYGDAHDEL